MISLDYHIRVDGIHYEIHYEYSGQLILRAEYQGPGCYVMHVSENALTMGGNFATAIGDISLPSLRAVEYAALALAESMFWEP